MGKLSMSNSPGKLFLIIFACIAVFFAVAVWPFYNLIPEYVTEEVRIVSNIDMVNVTYIRMITL